MENNFSQRYSFLIVAVALIVGLAVHGLFMASRSGTKGLTVVGSSKQRVTADLGKWNGSFSRQAGLDNLKTTMDQIGADSSQIKAFVTKLGIDASRITFLPVQVSPIYEQLTYGKAQTIGGYNVTQAVRVENEDIAKIDNLSTAIKQLIDRGIIFDYQNTEYYYTKIADLRPKLFADATQDAKQKADAVVKGTGASLGKLLTARTGVIQIMAPNSTDISDYGTYDLSTKDKDITATVTVTFDLN